MWRFTRQSSSKQCRCRSQLAVKLCCCTKFSYKFYISNERRMYSLGQYRSQICKNVLVFVKYSFKKHNETIFLELYYTQFKIKFQKSPPISPQINSFKDHIRIIRYVFHYMTHNLIARELLKWHYAPAAHTEKFTVFCRLCLPQNPNFLSLLDFQPLCGALL